MSKKCCKYHDKLYQAFWDNGIDDFEVEDCGMAGIGPAILCCENCPQRSFYISDPATPVQFASQRRPVTYVLDAIKAELAEDEHDFAHCASCDCIIDLDKDTWHTDGNNTYCSPCWDKEDKSKEQ